MLPIIGRVLMADMPEAERLFGRREVLDRIQQPEVPRYLPAGERAMAIWAQSEHVAAWASSGR